MKEFSEILKELRVNNNLTQEALGEIVHVSRSAIAKYENGLGIPSTEVIELLCKYFNVTKEELFPKEEVEHLIVEKNKKIKLFKILLIIIITLCTLFLGHILYYFINEAVVEKRDYNKDVAEIEKYQNISSYDFTLKEMYFENTTLAEVSYRNNDNLYIVEGGAKLNINVRVNKYLYDKILPYHIFIKFKGIKGEFIAYPDSTYFFSSTNNYFDEDEIGVLLYTNLFREQTVGVEVLQIEYIRCEYEMPYLNDESYLAYEKYEKKCFIELEDKNNKLNYVLYKNLNKKMDIYFYNDYVATIDFNDIVIVENIISDAKSTEYKFLNEKINDYKMFLNEKYHLEFSNNLTFETSDDNSLNFPRNNSFFLIVKSELIDEDINFSIENQIDNKIDMVLNENIYFNKFNLNGELIENNNININISNNNITYFESYNRKGINAQNIGNSSVTVEVDLGYYSKIFELEIEVLPICKVFCRYLSTFNFPYISEINDYLTEDVKKQIINEYNEQFNDHWKDVTKKVIDIYRPNEYSILPIFEGDFRFETSELYIYNNGKYEVFTDDKIVINQGEMIHMDCNISEEEEDELQLNKYTTNVYYEILKSEDDFFDKKNEIYNISKLEPGKYKIAIIFVLGNIQYYQINEFTLIIK